MGKAKRSKGTATARPTMREGPNWPLLGLALVGAGLAGYLTWTGWSGTAPQGCAAGGGCDTVLSSRWSTAFGVPTSLWGLLTYLALAASAFIANAHTHWRTAWLLSGFGLLYSVYLTTISLTVLGATCPYCLTSLAILTAIIALVTWQRPATLPRFAWQGWLLRTVPAAALGVGLLHLVHTAPVAEPTGPEDPMARALAIHLTESGALMYGAEWCQHCQQQKAYFGASATRLPYIECSTGGPRSPQTRRCQVDRISTYPTWVIKGRRIPEVLTLAQLAQESGFQMPAP